MYILLAILIFGILIFVHELGHFLAAKRFGVRVNEFAICMGPALLKKTVGETTYSLRCIPIGGYCAMEGEDEVSDDPRAFSAAKPLHKAIILIAGSAMNFLAGLLVLIVLYSTAAGFTTPVIRDFIEGSTLQQETGLQAGDEFYRIDGRRVYRYSDIEMLLSRNQSGEHDLTVKRDGKLLELEQVPLQKRPFEESGKTVYRYGIYFQSETKTVLAVLKHAWFTALDFARMVWMSLADLVKGLVSVNDMSGPVGIVSVIAQTGATAASASAAAMKIAYLAAFIAINLAVMNLLPIPALDGGRVFALAITFLLEKLLRRKIDSKYEGYIHAAGMILLLAFIGYVSLRDIWKLIAGV